VAPADHGPGNGAIATGVTGSQRSESGMKSSPGRGRGRGGDRVGAM